MKTYGEHTKEIIMNMGPQHPSTHGVLRLKLWLDGETVVKSEPIIGYLHRGIEKLAEYRTYNQFMPITDRLDYVSATSNNLAWVEAVEKLMEIEVPRRADFIRVIIVELMRISNHLIWLGTQANDIGAVTVLLYCLREREEILDIFEMFCGARLTTNAFRIGGLAHDIPEGFIEKVKNFVDRFPQYIDDYERLLSENRIWLKRTKNVGIISAQDGINIGLSGPSLRGAGVKWDIRKSNPYAVYNEFEFEIPTGEKGDVYDRYKVRIEEMRQSTKIIKQALEKLPEGEIMAKVPRIIKPPPGEVYHSIEAPKGELGFYIVSDGSTMPCRVKIRPPSFVNLQALSKMIEGQLVADIVAAIGSIDVVLGEIDR
ncbi:MAG: NADH-quinone oxidoreductase subunit D [Candidatus Aminicenantia bacterium]